MTKSDIEIIKERMNNLQERRDELESGETPKWATEHLELCAKMLGIEQMLDCFPHIKYGTSVINHHLVWSVWKE